VQHKEYERARVLQTWQVWHNVTSSFTCILLNTTIMIVLQTMADREPTYSIVQSGRRRAVATSEYVFIPEF
jgi:hypothetical protein